MNLLDTIFWTLIGLLTLVYFTYYALMIHEVKKASNVRKQEIFPKVSIVIPAHNEGKVIAQAIDKVIDLDYPKDKLEVIVVDDGSTDTTRRIVENYIDRNSSVLDLQLIVLPEWVGKPSALNTAWPHCSGEIVIISDADTYLERNAPRKIVRNFADSTVGAASGRQIVVTENQTSATRLEKGYRSIFEILRLGESNMDSTPIFNGPISSFRTELLRDMEPYAFTDDIELSVRTREKGYRAVYDPEAIAYSYIPTSLRSVMKQKSRRGNLAIQTFLRHTRILFNGEYGKYGFIIFPCEFFMHVISPVMVIFDIALAIFLIALDPTLVIKFFIFITIILLASGMLLIVSGKASPNNKAVINPLSILTTFIVHEVSLFLGLTRYLLMQTGPKWHKIKC